MSDIIKIKPIMDSKLKCNAMDIKTKIPLDGLDTCVIELSENPVISSKVYYLSDITGLKDGDVVLREGAKAIEFEQ